MNLTAHQQLAEEWVDAGKAHLIEQDDPSWWKAVKAVSLKKHYGPGPHKSGSPQSVHGGVTGGGGGTTIKSGTPTNFRPGSLVVWIEENGDTGGTKKRLAELSLMSVRSRTMSIKDRRPGDHYEIVSVVVMNPDSKRSGYASQLLDYYFKNHDLPVVSSGKCISRLHSRDY